MKFCYSFLFISLFTLFSLECNASPVVKGTSSLENHFAQLYQSVDFDSRITAIILTAEFKESSLNKALKQLLNTVHDIEQVAVLYALARCENDDYIEPFIQSLPTTEADINLLLDIESPRKSFFAAPSLRILAYLGSLALYNDEALKKLERISQIADGWQADSLSFLVHKAKKQRSNQK